MFERFRTARRHRRRNREIVEALFDSLVARSRNERLYAEFGVADSVTGRFEAICLEVYAFLRRCRADADLKPLAQDMIDRFITDIEGSIRELGVGDPSVPKRMRKLTGIFYERAAAYDAAIDAPQPREALANALPGRALAEDADGDAATGLASYVLDTIGFLDTVPADEILAGRLSSKTRT